MRWIFASLALLAAAPALASGNFLDGYDEAPTLAQALERARAQPDKHVLLYFGQSEFCPPCREARAVLNSEPVRAKWRPNYIVVSIDLLAPTKEEREVIAQVRVAWAPVLLFLNAEGRRVAYATQLRGESDALKLNEFVAQRQYALSTVGRYTAQDFDPGLVARAAAAPRRVDDRPRLRDVTSQPHERLSAAALRKLLAGARMRKENQDWFLTLGFKERNLLEVEGNRKNGRGDMRGLGKWYVTRKGKLCLEVSSRGVDENWCRHVFRAGATFYVSKDLRPGRVVYRMVPERG
jgi:thiol-disulfide isomerase/thioredoxin